MYTNNKKAFVWTSLFYHDLQIKYKSKNPAVIFQNLFEMDIASLGLFVILFILLVIYLYILKHGGILSFAFDMGYSAVNNGTCVTCKS